MPGPALYQHVVAPEGEGIKAWVGLIPGYADHGARYAHVMDIWAERGIATVALDVRGHGRAQGARGYCARFDEFLDDASELERIVTKEAAGRPMFLFGHSFGALVATSWLVGRGPSSWRGLVLSSPYFGLALQAPALKVALGRLASRVVPRLSLPSGLRGKDMTHDPERARAYDEDPLVFGNVCARWFQETELAQARLLARASEISLPLRIVFGTDDPIAKFATGRAFFESARSSDKTFDAREGLLHETWNEISWRDVVGATADWILERAG